jgi:hypothetical protein
MKSFILGRWPSNRQPLCANRSGGILPPRSAAGSRRYAKISMSRSGGILPPRFGGWKPPLRKDLRGSQPDKQLGKLGLP